MRVRRCLLICAAMLLSPALFLGAARGEEKSPPKVARNAPSSTASAKLVDEGTFIHVRNGTSRALDFTLFVECAAGGTGKFDRRIKLQPGDTAIWRLAAEQEVLTSRVQGTLYYRLGLVGKDPTNGKEHRWGLIGGPGMFGKERQATDEGRASTSRHIHVQPIGDI